MCGIIGIIHTTAQRNTRLLRDMTTRIRHRGPDDEGYALINIRQNNISTFHGDDSAAAIQKQVPALPENSDYNWQIGLGFRRYAIIDCSAQGHQPMQLGNLSIVCNGEIYNYQALKTALMPFHDFKTQTDTEVVLAAYAHWGTRAFEQLRGMFAIIIVDLNIGKIVVARDHFGKSPLYMHQDATACYFASDIEPILLAKPDLRSDINQTAVTNYITGGKRDLSHQTFWTGIDSFPNGHFAVFSPEQFDIQPVMFWTLPEDQPIAYRNTAQATQLTDTFRAHLSTAIERRLVGDRSVGLTLSGGLDSSALAAIWATDHYRDQPLDCFTVHYNDPRIDETPYAQAVVQAYPGKLRHHLVETQHIDVWQGLDAFMAMEEEPFHDPVMLIDFHQLQIIKAEGIDVVLTGAAGDELLAGYNGLIYKPALYRYLMQHDPAAFLAELPFTLRTEPKSAQLRMFNRILKPITKIWRKEAVWAQDPFKAFHAPTAPTGLQARRRAWLTDFQMNYWLRSQKHIWNIPIEPRAPFLDVDLANFCMQLPPQLLIHHGWQKYILRKVLEPILPANVVWRRKKTGFPFDTAQWLTDTRSAWIDWLQHADSPWISGPELAKDYDLLLRIDAQLLWRWLCLLKWYKLRVRQ